MLESCVDSLSQVPALHVRTKRSLIRAGVTQGRSGETLQSAGNTDTANTGQAPLSTLVTGNFLNEELS